MKELTRTTIENTFTVVLYKHGSGFCVKYGDQEMPNLNRSEAAAEYGICMMHALDTVGRLEPESRPRRVQVKLERSSKR